MIKKENQAYMAPTTDVLELRVESKILDGSLVYGDFGAAGGDESYNDYGSDF